MIKFALKGLLTRKLRTALTALAIVLGVAMISGTYVLTDSIDSAFDQIFTDVREGSDVVITGKSAFDLSDGSGVTEPTLDDALLDEVRGLDGVAQAEGSVDSDSTSLIGKDNKAIVYGGAPNLGFAIPEGESSFNPLRLVEGTWPGPDEVVIDSGVADKEDFAIGDEIGVQVEGPVSTLRISGIVEFGSNLSIGGATLAGFDLPTAQRLFEKEGRLDEIAVAGEPGVSTEELLGEIRPILPQGAQAVSGLAAGRERRVGDERVHHVPPGIPARVRRDRALRRLLRDRELALHHDRAADARVRDAAHPRRLAAPGSDVGHPRVVRRRRRRLRGRALPRAAPRQGPLLRCSTRSASRSRTSGSCSRRAR